MILFAPAKLNLYLRVLGKRPDGYHNIETIFERIALFDRIILRSLKKDEIKVFSDHPDVPCTEDGLIYRAVSLFKKAEGISRGLEVKIFKNIPIASGLGGGSSDAACVLTGLNRLWKTGLGLSRLSEYARHLGADIPFFLNKGSFAKATDRGDVITPLKWKGRFWHLLITPPLKIFSKDVYGAYKNKPSSNLTKRCADNKMHTPGGNPKSSSFIKFEGLKKLIINDLEKVVLEKEPLVGRLKDALKDIGLGNSHVSGSGPSVFSIFEKRKEAVRSRELLVKHLPVVKNKGWQIFIVRTL